MFQPKYKSPVSSPIAGIRGVSASLGLTLLLGASGAVLAQELPTRNNVRVPPNSPTETGDANPGDTPTASNARFTCQVVDGEYTVMYSPQSQPGQVYEWAKPSTLGGGWTEDRRCNEIARRLEFYREDGMQELAIGSENGYDTICVTTEKNPTCQIVLTVPPGENPQLIRDRVFENLTVADSGRQTEAVNALVDNGQGGNVLQTLEGVFGMPIPGRGPQTQVRPGSIDLRPFLDPVDGGTGVQLRENSSNGSSHQLNPENFR